MSESIKTWERDVVDAYALWKNRRYLIRALLDGAELPKAPYGYHIWDIVEEETESYWNGMKRCTGIRKERPSGGKISA